MARDDPYFRLRIPEILLDQVRDAAEANHRSATAEIIARLEATFDDADLPAIRARVSAAEERVRIDRLETAEMRETLHLLKVLGELIRVGEPEAVAHAIRKFQDGADPE